MPRLNLSIHKSKGLYQKYIVKRTDGSHRKGKKHEGCTYFVLDTVHDKFATTALLAYADACEAEFPELARDIRSHHAPRAGVQSND